MPGPDTRNTHLAPRHPSMSYALISALFWRMTPSYVCTLLRTWRYCGVAGTEAKGGAQQREESSARGVGRETGKKAFGWTRAVFFQESEHLILTSNYTNTPRLRALTCDGVRRARASLPDSTWRTCVVSHLRRGGRGSGPR